MNSKANAVFWIGFILIFLNFWISGQSTSLWTSITTGGKKSKLATDLQTGLGNSSLGQAVSNAVTNPPAAPKTAAPPPTGQTKGGVAPVAATVMSKVKKAAGIYPTVGGAENQAPAMSLQSYSTPTGATSQA